MKALFHHPHVTNFNQAKNTLHWLMKNHSHEVHPFHWQGSDVRDRPEMKSHELMNVDFTIDLRGLEDLAHWRQDIEPNLPWADSHFEERVCGVPLNPGAEWENWPWATSADKFRDDKAMFNHTYAERYWPKFAGSYGPLRTPTEARSIHSYWGIRNQYGDLDDLVAQLVKDPHSRQEWFPVFHPEDVGSVTGGRKPCTLGYQFMRRDDCLHVYYPLRSCDLLRHWPDDCYLTVRLLLWVLDKCRRQDPRAWASVRPGAYTMHMTSLHVFANDMRLL